MRFGRYGNDSGLPARSSLAAEPDALGVFISEGLKIRVNPAVSRRVVHIQFNKNLRPYMIPARFVNADDLQACHISTTENLLREDLSAIEMVEAVVAMADMELVGDKDYASMGETPAERVKNLLVKLESVRRNKARGFNVTKTVRYTSNKFIGRVEEIFGNGNFSINPGRLNKMLDTGTKICFNAFYDKEGLKRRQESQIRNAWDGRFCPICEENSRDC